MAGTFWHLTLARQAIPLVNSGWSEEEGSLLGRAFCAGSIAPDLGFFPGGPRAFSERAHHQDTGDFLRALGAGARDSLERAFVFGWALHLYTDIATHPWINEFADRTVARLGCQTSRRDLWHLRLENGIDCHFLEQPEQRFLWSFNLDWDRGGGAELLAAVGGTYFGEVALESALSRGIRSQCKWVARLPKIFLLTGHTRPVWLPSASFFGRLLRPLVSTAVGDWLGETTGWTDVGAVANPIKVDPGVLQRVDTLSSNILEAFERGVIDEFSSLRNVDLDTGKALADG